MPNQQVSITTDNLLDTKLLYEKTCEYNDHIECDKSKDRTVRIINL